METPLVFRTGDLAPMSLPTIPPESQAVRDLAAAYEKLTDEIGKVIVGQQQVVEQVLMSLFSRGHCLLVGVPGLAKTLLVSTVSKVLNLSFKRIQFTPDLMPSDITGTDILQDDPETGRRRFVFLPGPVFANMILADEINRTAPKSVPELLAWGAGPRASQYLILGAKARAILYGRLHATTEDVREVAHPVLRHRLITTFNADADGVTTDMVIGRLLEAMPAHRD